tara:strand:- start:9289 stop:9495 length:207 start_codon:yes stop_codon:yes gene_type:complete
MNKENTKLENFLEIKEKHDRMKGLVEDYMIEYQLEKYKPLLDEGFDSNDIIEFFTIKLMKYINTKYEY